MKAEFYKFLNLDQDDKAELSIYDEIGFWGTRAKDFQAQLKQVKGSKLTVRINSPGGEVVAGYAIYNLLRASGKEVTTVVDGIAASIASVIAMAGKTIKMPENALMFIHDPLVGVMGNAEELRKTAEDLDKLKEGILGIYEARTGSDRAKIKKMMAEETLLTAKECKLLGFCDEVMPENKAAAKANFDVVDYFPGIKLPTVANPAPVGAQNKTKENDTMTLEQAQQEIATLKATNSTLTTQVAEAKKTATQEATNAVTTAENKRKADIKAFAAKYNKDGDLNDAVIEALAGTTTLDEFKDKVLEIVNNRPTKAAAKKDGNGQDPEAGTDADLQKQYEACKTAGERRAFLNKNRQWANRMARTR